MSHDNKRSNEAEEKGQVIEGTRRPFIVGFLSKQPAWFLLPQLAFWQPVPLFAVRHGDPNSLWFTNCFTNTSSPWEVWCAPSPPQLSWATEPNLTLFTTATEIFTEGKKPSPLSQSFIFKSTLSSSLFALSHVLLQGISPYSNGNCCCPINRRKVMWTAQKALDSPSYGTFTFSALFFEKYSMFGFVFFFPTRSRHYVKNLNLGNMEWNLSNLKYPR